MSDLSYKTPHATAEGTKQVKICKPLHKRLKKYAADTEDSLQTVVERQLWPLVGGQPQSATPSGEKQTSPANA